MWDGLGWMGNGEGGPDILILEKRVGYKTDEMMDICYEICCTYLYSTYLYFLHRWILFDTFLFLLSAVTERKKKQKHKTVS